MSATSLSLWVTMLPMSFRGDDMVIVVMLVVVMIIAMMIMTMPMTLTMTMSMTMLMFILQRAEWCPATICKRQ